MKLGKWTVRQQNYLPINAVYDQDGTYVCGGVAKEYEQLINLVPEMVAFIERCADELEFPTATCLALASRIRQAMEDVT